MRNGALSFVSALLATAITLVAQKSETAAVERPAIRIIKLSGKPFERGLAHGRALKDEIQQLIAEWRRRLRRKYEVEPDEFIARFRRETNFEPAIDKWTPGLLDEVRGIAKGAELDFATVYVWQLVDEVWAQGRKVMAEKCTSIGVDRRGDQPTIVAQNLDIPTWYHGTQTVLHITDDKSGLRQLILTIPGLVAANGMNSSRIGVCVNTLLQLRPCKDGLPVAFVVRGVLRHKDWSKARAFLYDVRHASGQNYILGGPEVAHAFECSAGRVVRFIPFADSHRTWHTNHPLVNEDWAPSLVKRAKRVGKSPKEALRECSRFAVLEKRLKKGVEVGFDTVRQVLAAKDSKVPICNRSTYACTIMVLGGVPELHVCAGGLDQHELQVLKF